MSLSPKVMQLIQSLGDAIQPFQCDITSTHWGILENVAVTLCNLSGTDVRGLYETYLINTNLTCAVQLVFVEAGVIVSVHIGNPDDQEKMSDRLVKHLDALEETGLNSGLFILVNSLSGTNSEDTGLRYVILSVERVNTDSDLGFETEVLGLEDTKKFFLEAKLAASTPSVFKKIA